MHSGKSGIAAIEMAIILPLLLTMFCVIIDTGRLFQARLVITNVAREGGSVGSRDILTATPLIAMLQNAASPLDLVTSGKIYIWKIRAGADWNYTDPTIDLQKSANAGNLSVSSSIGINEPRLGLSGSIYNHLVFDSTENTACIGEVTVVEVFYKYVPVTPIKFLPGITSDGTIMSSKMVL